MVVVFGGLPRVLIHTNTVQMWLKLLLPNQWSKEDKQRAKPEKNIGGKL